MPSNSEDTFNQMCEALGFSDNPGLIIKESATKSACATPWFRIMEKVGIDAIFFVRTDAESPLIPMIYFKKLETFNERITAELHKKIWNLGKIPFLFVVLPNQIKIYNCFEPPQFSSNESFDSEKRLVKFLKAYIQLEDIRRELSSFTYEKLCSGRFWHEKSDLFNLKNRADIYLLDHLRSVRKILKSKGLDDKYIHRLIARSILVLCLEDRGALKEFYSTFLDGKYKEVGFRQVENKEHAYQIFELITEHFNGDVFPITETEKEAVSEKHFNVLKQFFLGTDPESGQTRLWPYRFDIIPIEFISSIYEEFFHYENDPSTRKQTIEDLGTFYTPQSLVNFILDDIMVWQEKIYPKILDPSCGSGIFLVEAYRKIVDKILLDKEALTEDELRQTLQDVLKKSIFGVDLNREAVSITAFSLYLAMLDYIPSDSLWQLSKLFPKLMDINLFSADFFDSQAQFNNMQFDHIIGNVPWLSVSRDSSTKALRYCQLHNRPIGDRQIAQAFVWKALDLVDNESVICLIVGAKSLLFNRSEKNKSFRQKLLKIAQVQTIVNLSILRHSLFSKSVGPAAIINCRKRINENDPYSITYVCPKTFCEAKYVGAIIIDKSDYSVIPIDLAKDNDLIWKIAMWGTPRDLRIITRATSNLTLRTLIKEKNWKIGDGFQRNGPGKRKNSPWLLRYPYIPAKLLSKYLVENEKAQVLTDPIFRRPKTSSRFTAPLCLVKVTLNHGHIVSAYSDSDVSYTDGIIGISGSSNTDADLLKILCCYLNSDIARYFIFLTCSVWGVERDDILKDDLENIPVVLPNQGTQSYRKLLELYELILEQQKKKNPDSLAILKLEESIKEIFIELMSIDEIDRKLIDETDQYTIDYFQKKSKSIAVKAVNTTEMCSYAQDSLDLLNSFLGNSKQKFSSKVYTGNTSLKVVLFELCVKSMAIEVIKDVNQLNSVLTQLFSRLREIKKENIILQKIMRIYDGQLIAIVKPNELRYWTVIEALRDADETLVEVLEAWRNESELQTKQQLG